MAQMVLRKLADDVRDGLRLRATRNGRSAEAEARAILSEVIRAEPSQSSEYGLGTEIVNLFAGGGFADGEIQEIRGDGNMRSLDFK